MDRHSKLKFLLVNFHIRLAQLHEGAVVWRHKTNAAPRCGCIQGLFVDHSICAKVNEMFRYISKYKSAAK